MLEFLGDKILSLAVVKALSDEYAYQTDDEEYAIEFDEEDLTDILAFSQPVVATDTLYEEIMRALLSGTAEGYVSPFSQGVTCRNIMLLQNILYIDMSWQFNEMPRENFFACISVLVATYTGFSEVSFVNLTVEGKQITLPERPAHPIMLLSRYTGTIQSLNNHYSRHVETDFSGIETFYGAMYVSDETNKYILPKRLEYIEEENAYYYAVLFNTEWNYHRYCPRRYHRWLRKFGWKVQQDLIEKYENPDYTKTELREYDDHWVKFEEKA